MGEEVNMFLSWDSVWLCVFAPGFQLVVWPASPVLMAWGSSPALMQSCQTGDGQWAMASLLNAGHLLIACVLLLSGAVCRSWQWWLTWLVRHFENDPGAHGDSWCCLWWTSSAPANLVQISVLQTLSNIDLTHALLVVASKRVFLYY